MLSKYNGEVDIGSNRQFYFKRDKLERRGSDAQVSTKASKANSVMFKA